MKDHWFWWTLTLAVLAWYSTVTVYVAVRGAFDVRRMLRQLARRQSEKPDADDHSEPLSPP